MTVDWGPQALSIYRSSAWRGTPGDAPLLQVPSDDPPAIAQILSALSREQYQGLAVETTARLHPPLAELLARAFAEFRRQVVDTELLAGGPDEVAALRLFHQLLFMRFNEDRFGVPARVRVARSLQSDDLALSLVGALRWYARRFNSELFADQIDPAWVPQPALRTVIQTLVEPWAQLHLDFSVTKNEVAGRLYQSYLRLAPARVDEGRLFPGAEIRSKQRQSGAYYTPAPIAGFLVRATLGAWLREHRPTKFKNVRVLDPACGSGAFLVAVFRTLVDYWEVLLRRPLHEDERAELLSTSIFGVDIDDAAVMLCRTQLLEEASLAHHVLPNLARNVVAGDSLTGEGLPEGFLSEASFDVVLANPPFAAPRLASLKHLSPSMLNRYSSLRGTGRNFAYAFAELAAELVNNTGRVGLVVPRALLDGPSSAAARKVLGPEHVELVLDLGRNVVFDFTLAYVGALVLTNAPTTPLLARLRDDLVPKVEVLEWLNELDPQGLDDAASVTALVRPDSEAFRQSDSWSPFTVRWRAYLRDMIGVPMSELGRDEAPTVVIGTQTGADERFVLQRSEYSLDDGEIITNGVHLPIGLAPYWVKGDDIDPFRIRATGRRALLPTAGVHPGLDQFIIKRGGVPVSFRAGQLELLRRPKVLVRNLFLEPAAAADLIGDYMPPQGVVTALVPAGADENEVLFIEALLNSSLYQWLLQGLAHPRSGAYGRLMAHHWSDVPWPRLGQSGRKDVITAATNVRALFADISLQSGGFAAGLTDRYWRSRRELDEVVLNVLAVEETLRDVINRELWRLT